MAYSQMDIMNGGGGGGLPQQLPVEAVLVFKEGITLLLSRWSALEMAVVNEWGGRDSRRKSEQLADDIFTWFTQSKEPLYIDDLESLLDEAMLSLNTMTEDGSVEEVAEKLMIMHEECLESSYKSVESLREVPRTRAVSHITQGNDDGDDEDDDGDEEESMAVDAPDTLSNLKPVDMFIDEPRPPKTVAEAEDGWTRVPSKKNRGKRNQV